VVGFIPLTVYLWVFFSEVQLNIFLWTSILTGIAFMLVGWMKSLVNQTPPLKSIAETLLLGLLAALVAYFIGDLLEEFFISK
jgi:VIT1/CCC1 family predicted Fe2+/Mn2+ transporter